MPVSPQDFALWSDLTGNPYPRTPAERMALAPTVYDFNRNLGRSGGPTMGPVRRAIDVAGKTALAVGALAGAAYLGSKGFQKLNLDNEPEVGSTVAESMPDVSSQASETSGDITPPTTAQRFSQAVIPDQTSIAQETKGVSPAKPTFGRIEQKPVTQSELIATGQHFSPGSEVDQARQRAAEQVASEGLIGEASAAKAEAFRRSKTYALMQKQYPSLREIESPSQESFEAPTSLTNVQPTVPTRIPSQEESPIVAMAKPSPRVPVASVVGPSQQEIRDLDVSLARSMANRSMEERSAIRDQLLSKKYPSIPASQVHVSRTEPGRPAATVPGTEEHLIAQAMEHLEGTKSVPPGTMSQNLKGSSVRNITVYPNDQVSVTYHNDPETSYAFKSDPRYTEELKTMMHQGHFGPGGLHSAGGFIQAGINKGLLY